MEREFGPLAMERKFAANFNAAPGQVVPAIRAGHGPARAVMLRWGLAVPGSFNVPVEMLATSAEFREPWKRGRRCIIPALGFYEWHVNPDATEQPYYIHPDDQDVFGFAGLWNVSVADANGVTECCSIITLPANALLAEIDNSAARMPAILTREQRQLWLLGPVDAAGAALAAYPAERLLAYAVSTRINSPLNNDEALLEPLETDVD